MGCELRIDKQTLKCCFRAFALTLKPSDYYRPAAPSGTSADSIFSRSAALKQPIASPQQAVLTQPAFMPSPPGGQMPLNSPLYVSRTEAERSCAQALTRPGALLRIKGARQTGKTSLMARLTQQAIQQGYQPVLIRFQLAEKSVLQDLESLLKWFCASVGLGLGRSPDLDTYWDSLFGSKVSCKLYFEQYLLAGSDRPVVLMLDDVDRLFHNLEVADEFFGLLRTWYEEAKTSETWQKLRMVIAQSSEVYIPLNINKSPFNVGVAVTLPPFTPQDIQSMAAAYDLTWPPEAAAALCQLIGGHPYLAHLTVDAVQRTQTPLSAILADPLGSDVFLPHLQHHLNQVQQQDSLTAVLSHLLDENMPPSSGLAELYQLQGMGLVTFQNDVPKLSCDLFAAYFSSHLSLLAA